MVIIQQLTLGVEEADQIPRHPLQTALTPSTKSTITFLENSKSCII